MKKPLPIGVDNFEDIVKSRYCYVDKTMFIKELLDLKGKVNLFTRPRRFGKTLNLRLRRITVCSYYRVSAYFKREYIYRAESSEDHFDTGPEIW